MPYSKFTPHHLTILISIYTGNTQGYVVTDLSNDYELDLCRQGLLYRNDSNFLEVTEYGKAKINELLLRLGTPNQQYKTQESI